MALSEVPVIWNYCMSCVCEVELLSVVDKEGSLELCNDGCWILKVRYLIFEKSWAVRRASSGELCIFNPVP